MGQKTEQNNIIRLGKTFRTFQVPGLPSCPPSRVFGHPTSPQAGLIVRTPTRVLRRSGCGVDNTTRESRIACKEILYKQLMLYILHSQLVEDS